MRRIPFLMIGSALLLVAACGGDPAASIELREVPGDIDGRVVINPDDFELTYNFACEPLNCITECSIQEGDWFKCESPYVLTEDSEEHDISEGVLRFSVRSVHNEEKSSAKHVDLLVLYEFDFDIEPVHGLETGGGNFYYEDEYLATCSRSDCEIFCQWQTESSLVDQPCSLKDSFSVELPSGVEEASLIIEACAKNFGGKVDDEHCTEPREYKFYAAPPGWIEVSVGDQHSCAILADNSLWCWGANNAGQLGINTQDASKDVPTRVPLESWEAVSAGSSHTCGITTGGHLYCWGETTNGRLGQSNPSNPRQPVKIDEGPFIAVAAGGAHSCAVKEGGDLYCWGFNNSGQVGDGTNENKSEPTLIAPPEAGRPWMSVTAGEAHTCAIGETASGPRAYCWGDASNGRLGNDQASGVETTPTMAEGALRNANTHTISAGAAHTCATASVSNTRRSYCWGVGASGRLGTGNDQNFQIPDRVEGNDKFETITAGKEHSCGIMENGEAYCWGENIRGQLGIDSEENTALSPTEIAMPFGLGLKAISAGSEHTCGIGTNDRLYCWGRYEQGRLGIAGVADKVAEPEMVTWPQGEFIPGQE